jgi:hypothetical protein
MAQSRTKRTEKRLLTPENCVVAITDLQPQMLFGGGRPPVVSHLISANE